MPDFGIMRGFNDKLFGDKLVAGQLPTQLGLIGSSDFGTDPDAQAFFDRVTTAGGSLSATEKLAVDTLVKQMKLDGIWTLMKAIYPMVGASAAACAQNLKSSSFTGTFTTGFTFASTGVTGNGVSSYMNTNFAPSGNLIVANNHLSFYSRTALSSTFGSEIGLMGYSGTAWMNMRTNNPQTYAFGQDMPAVFSTTTGDGFILGISRSVTDRRILQDNILNVVDTRNNTGTLSTQNIIIFAGLPFTNYSSVNQCAFASIGDGLTDTEASNFYTAVQAFQTTLSRQV
jgi:hypothetical protein